MMNNILDHPLNLSKSGANNSSSDGGGGGDGGNGGGGSNVSISGAHKKKRSKYDISRFAESLASANPY